MDVSKDMFTIEQRIEFSQFAEYTSFIKNAQIIVNDNIINELFVHNNINLPHIDL